jgi:hypothetical protein
MTFLRRVLSAGRVGLGTATLLTAPGKQNPTEAADPRDERFHYKPEVNRTRGRVDSFVREWGGDLGDRASGVIRRMRSTF